MVIDTSAVMAILLGEPEAERIIDAITRDTRRLISAFTVLECSAVIEARKGPAGARELDLLLHEGGVELVAMDAEQVGIARRAYHQYGKGRHPAKLNLGDCCSYALSIHSGEPLLFKGGDFTKTDVEPVAIPPLQ
jgi:ribonuclease VapC